jgi:hypothetical protein
MGDRSERRGGTLQPLLLASTSEPSVSQPRLEVASAETAAPAPQWSGLFWGASFGGGFTQAQVKSHETYTDSIPSNSYPFQTQAVSSVAKSSGHDTGATLDLFTGLNLQIGRHVVGGVQVEGSIADLSFDSDGTRSLVYSNDAGPTGQTAKGPFRPHVDPMLTRGGWSLRSLEEAYSFPHQPWHTAWWVGLAPSLSIRT